MASGFSWPCRGFGPPTFKNSWFFTFFKSPVRPSADFGLVDLRKLVVFCDFQVARATLCGLWAGQPSKTRGFLRFSNRSRDPLRTLGWSTLENSWFFAISKSLAQPFAEFRVVESLSLWRGAHFAKPVGFAPTQTSCELEAIAKPLGSLLKRFSLSTSARLNSALARGSTCFVELLLLNFLFKNSTFEAFFVQIQDPLLIVCD